MKITLMRSAAALAVAALLPISSPAAAEPKNAAPRVLPIDAAVAALQTAAESRTGYSRTAFKHWTAGDNAADGCTTRLISMLHAVTGLFSQRMQGVVGYA
ncbi:hypothetical protein B9W68_30335 [Streptomyces sp. CS227]|uniref:hypothetical protein n=1 Tax=Streptomyces sp. CS227 TaxID=1982763 RepID=UPI000B40AFF5|nr:hypothetical protein [Streptomyces sp. CS227]OWA01570.1 hypothetical protein B9W68_30335 [Streptomyces sp. CS227]